MLCRWFFYGLFLWFLYGFLRFSVVSLYFFIICMTFLWSITGNLWLLYGFSMLLMLFFSLFVDFFSVFCILDWLVVVGLFNAQVVERPTEANKPTERYMFLYHFHLSLVGLCVCGFFLKMFPICHYGLVISP